MSEPPTAPGLPSWRQLTLLAGPHEAPRLERLLSEAGALCVTLGEAGGTEVYEPPPGETPLWESTRVSGLFEAGADLGRVLAALRRGLGSARLPRHRIETLEGRDWSREWRRGLRPLRFGGRLWVCPAGCEPPRPGGARVVRLDPGLAFGSGTHPSTALCLEWLARHLPRGAAVIDYGCGSGLLALAALRLGAARAWAVDVDPQARAASRANARRNGVAAELEVLAPEALPAVAADVLLANILVNPLVELAPALAPRVRPGGRLVLAGVLEAQAARVRAAYAGAFRFTRPARRGGWVRLAGRRRGAGHP